MANHVYINNPFNAGCRLVGKESRESSVETLRPDSSAAASPAHTLKNAAQISPIIGQGQVNSWSPSTQQGFTGTWEQNQIRQIFQVIDLQCFFQKNIFCTLSIYFAEYICEHIGHAV